MQNFNQEHQDEVEFLSQNDPKGNKKGRRTGKFIPINEAPDFSVSSNEKENEEEIVVPEFMSKVALLYNLKDKLNYETDSKEIKILEKKIKKLEEEVKYEEEQEKINLEKMSHDVKILAKKGVAHIGPDFNVFKNISGFKRINEAEDKIENGDIEIGGKKIKSRTLSKFGKFLPNFMSKSKRLTSILPNDFLSRKKGQRWKYGSINKKEQNLKTLNKQKPKESFGGHATISKLAKQNRGKIRNEMLHNPEVWDEGKIRLNPEDLMGE